MNDMLPDFCADSNYVSIGMGNIVRASRKPEVKTKPLYNRSIPFPQADDFKQICRLFMKFASKNEMAIDDLFSGITLSSRQKGYYVNALAWLNVIEKQKGFIKTTAKGRSILFSHPHAIGAQLLAIALTNPVFETIAKTGYVARVKYDTNLRASEGLMNNQTFNRRIQTVASWLKYA